MEGKAFFDPAVFLPCMMFVYLFVYYTEILEESSHETWFVTLLNGAGNIRIMIVGLFTFFFLFFFYLNRFIS